MALGGAKLVLGVHDRAHFLEELKNSDSVTWIVTRIT